MDEVNDQDIDTAGTEADPDSPAAKRLEQAEGPREDAPDSDTQAPGSTGVARGSDHRTLHRREDDQEAAARSPEFTDRPAADREPSC
jgi:hypothetical protein